MKRALVADYGSDSDRDDPNDQHTPEPKEPARPVKQRKVLPSLSDNFLPKAPVDNPALHQGRIRTVPFVAGQWCAHVYVPVELSPSLDKVLRALIKRAKELCPTLHSLLDPPAPPPSTQTTPEPHAEARQETRNAPPEELHISLTRPIFLRSHQRAPLVAGIRAAVRDQMAFEVSFARLAVLENDEHTRTFLACEVGAGFSELQGLTKLIDPCVRELRQDTYYREPRYHASIGWALLSHPSAAPTRSGSNLANGSTSSAPSSAQGQSGSLEEEGGKDEEEFPTIPRFPDGFLETLQAEFGEKIREAVTVDEVRVRKGKEETRIRLRG